MTSNGLTVLLMEDHSAPVATIMVTYLVGSRNEAIGYTGATHLLEHLMFKGSETYNKEKDNAIWTMLQNVGAQINATTWLDRTNYFEMLPSEHLETAIAIEADRMRRALLRDDDRQPEMTVVRNEFERGENDPFDTLDKHIWATAYQAHPYHHSTIGWKSDIEGVSTERLRAFYDTYYWPNNATVTVIGDFKTQRVLSWIKTYFGQHPASPDPIPEMYTTEPKQEGPRRFVIKRAGETGIVGVAHKTPEGRHADKYASAVLSNILGTGKTSTFYRTLVDKGLATSTSVWDHPFHDNGLLITYAFLTPATDHQKVEKIILNGYAKIKDGGVTEEEVKRAQAQISAGVAFSRDGSYSIASSLNEAIATGDWTYYTTYLEHLQAVTAEDVQRVARTYMQEDQSTTGWFVPLSNDGAASGADPGGSAKGHAAGPRHYRSDGKGGGPGPTVGTVPPPGAVAPVTRVAPQIDDGEVLKGLRLLTLPMGVEDVVTIYGSFYGGDVFSPQSNFLRAHMTAAMLDQGTRKRDKFAISALLESVGARLSFSSDDYRVSFSARCLKADVPLVIELMAEQLREPAYNQGDLTSLKKRAVGNLKREREDTDARARMAFSQLIYPPEHPNYIPSTDDQIAAIEQLKRRELQTFHGRHYGLGSMIMVATGDIDRQVLEENLKERFGHWQVVQLTPPSLDNCRGSRGLAMIEEIVTMEDKTSVDLIMGMVVGLDREHPDYLPLFMGSYILGGNFAARLMTTVRDEAGLTYGVGSSVAGAEDGKDGYWAIHGTFAPNLLSAGKEATLVQFDKWLKDGVTAEELSAKKTTLLGTFRVGLATTRGMASVILGILERGKELAYIDEYVDEINALTLKQVNAAIRKYIRRDNLIQVAAGTIDQAGKPLGST